MNAGSRRDSSDNGRTLQERRERSRELERHRAQEIQSLRIELVRRYVAKVGSFLDSCSPEHLPRTAIREAVATDLHRASVRHFRNAGSTDGFLELATATIIAAGRRACNACGGCGEEYVCLFRDRFTLAEEDKMAIPAICADLIGRLNEFTVDYEPVVCRYVIDHCRVPYSDRHDAIQECLLAIRRSAIAYNPDRGCFASYAMTAMHHALFDLMCRKSGITSYAGKLVRRYERAEKRVGEKLQRRPRECEVFAESNLSDEEQKTCTIALRTKRAWRYGGTDDDFAERNVPDDHPDPVIVASEHEEALRLHTVIKELPVYEYKVILSIYFGDRSVRETAEELGIPPSRVRRILNNAKSKLKCVLQRGSFLFDAPDH